MRIAFMHRQLSGGGTEADLTRVAAALAARGHEMHLVCAKPNAVVPGAHVHRVPLVRAGRAARALAFALLAPRVAARLGTGTLVGFGRTVRQDVARIGGGTHRSYLRAMRAAGGRRRGIGPYHRAVLWIERRQFAADGHRAIVAVAERVRREICADYGVAGERVHVLYNGVDGERFRPDAKGTVGVLMRRALGVAPDERVCLAIGSGFERKGFDVLLAMWREDPPPDMRLVLVGNDERLAAYRRMATPFRRVTILGPRDDVPGLLAAADVLCVPSRQEAFGNVVLEACAAGVPVVTSTRVGAAELLEGTLRTLVVDDPLDRARLRAALVEAVGSGHEEFAQAARALAETLPWAAHVDRFEALLTGVPRG